MEENTMQPTVEQGCIQGAGSRQLEAFRSPSNVSGLLNQTQYPALVCTRTRVALNRKRALNTSLHSVFRLSLHVPSEMQGRDKTRAHSNVRLNS